MKALSYISFLFLLIQSCQQSSQNTTEKNKTAIFRTSEKNLVFSLKIDNDFSYYDSLTNKDIPLGYEIGSYQKQENKNSIIKLRINNKDTFFSFPLYKVDSILFGLRSNRSFYIITNHDKEGWLMD